MCTKKEAKTAANEAVEELLFTPDHNGHTRFGREVHDAVFNTDGSGESRFQRELKKAFYASVGKWLIGGGIVMISALTATYLQVQQNTDAINEGGRYTEADAIEDNRLQEGRDSRQDAEIQLLREETNDKFDTINNKLDQLIQTLIR